MQAARERQAARLAGTGAVTNAAMSSRLVRESVQAEGDAVAVLRSAYREGRLSARGHQRILRVARTIADLGGSERVQADHVAEAITLRQDVIGDEVLAA